MPFCNWILDIFVVLFLALGFYVGWKRGFLKIVLKTFAGLFSAVIAMSFFDNLGSVLKEKYVFTFVHNKISAAIGELGAGVDAAAMADAVPSALQKAASLVGIDLVGIAESAVQSGKDSLAEFVENASHSISQLISSAAAFVILFLLSFFVLRVLSTPINAIVMKIPLLGHVNRFLGLLFGALTALILAWLFIKLVGFLDETFELTFIEVKDAWASGAFYRFSFLS